MDEKYTVIKVKDTGVGMKREVYNELFIENRSYTSAGTKNEMGAGLGLLLVKEFIKNNNGTLQVNTEEHKGSEFIVTLPATE